VLTRDADPHSINFLATFIHDCQKRIYGEQLSAIKCMKDSDCYSNSCNITIGVCNQGIEDTLSCLADTIDPAVARFLFNSWKILANATKERMVDEFRNRFVKSGQCVGSTSINYRYAYQHSYSINHINRVCTEITTCGAEKKRRAKMTAWQMTWRHAAWTLCAPSILPATTSNSVSVTDTT
jgi:hypothetical protein